MSVDNLKNLDVNILAGWYQRLADKTARERIQGQEPLASLFLKEYLRNRKEGSIYKFNPPKYLRENKKVIEGLKYHKEVFLTIKKAKIGKNQKIWAGIIPRIQGDKKFKKWDTIKPLKLHYHSLVDIAENYFEILKLQQSGSKEEKDIFASLRGFQLKSRVVLEARKIRSSQDLQIIFRRWSCEIIDKYDFDEGEYLTLPNPDYRGDNKHAVQPLKSNIRVYHSNAKRLEKAGLAASFNVHSELWEASGFLKSSVKINPNERKF